jgi:thiol-disulfide isomerase/thioredoxin
MNDLKYPVGYLEKSDFSESGKLLGSLGRKPVLIMIQAGYCGACTSAKPEFQKLAEDGVVRCMTIQLDGERQGEKDLSVILDNIYPNLQTVPNYVLYVNGGSKKIPYGEGDRTYSSLKNFIMQHV